MIPNRVEELAGRRWASETCFAFGSELKLPGGGERLLITLRHGKQQKPERYARGVQQIITIVEDALDIRALGEKV